MGRAFRWFGESAFLVETLPGEDRHALAEALRELPGVGEVLPGAEILVRSSSDSAQDVLEIVESLPRCETPFRSGKVVEIPVVFDGPDLEEVARRSSMPTADLLHALTETALEVEYLGFAPGFAYMTGLPHALANVPRRPTPRTSVPAGSVAIAGGYLGIYPQASPGGWNIVGRTGMVMFDPVSPPHSALQPGDLVRLIPTAHTEPRLPDSAPARPRSRAARRMIVEKPGSLSTLQDAGRMGVGHLGLPKAGPADPEMMRLANIVAGNPEHSGVLETTFDGPSVRFSQDADVVVMGATLSAGSRDLESGAVVRVRGGDLLEIGGARAVHGYLAVAGGIRGPELFGSSSSDLLSGLGTGALAAGDELELGDPGRSRGYAPEPGRQSIVRVIPGPEPAPDDLLLSLVSAPFEVSGESNRIGVRLAGRRLTGTAEAAPKGSYGMVEGAVQLPPSGQPIVLLCDHATMGGYPVVATVISADIGVIAQRRPGDEVRFELVSRQEALRARDALERGLVRAPKGTFPGADF